MKVTRWGRQKLSLLKLDRAATASRLPRDSAKAASIARIDEIADIPDELLCGLLIKKQQ